MARVEERTFIATKSKDQAGPTNNWVEEYEMKKKILEVFKGSMRGRTMYVVPFCMGPLDSPLAKIGVQVTDSAYAVINMRIMAHMGSHVLDRLEKEAFGEIESRRTKPGFFIPCLHSVGMPLEEGQEDVPWPCNDEKIHRPLRQLP